jgi:lysine decarboxylase
VSEQRNAPYLDAVTGYGFRGPGRFHVPGHKGGPGADPGLRRALGEQTLAIDVPQDIEGIDVGPSPTAYELAEQLAAAAYGARRSWFLTNGATQGNHALCLALAPLGTTVVVQRNSHASLVDGLVLSGGLPVFVAPEYDPGLGMAHGVTPGSLGATLERAPQARAAFIVSPTYYGFAADVAGCADVAHAAGVPLIVDQSWGPHLGFHEALPPSALEQGADAVLTSTHKLAGSLTQSAILHLGPSDRIDAVAIGRAVRIVRSTSPSSLLLASLDAARRQLAIHGEQLLHETLQAIEQAREKLRSIDGVELIDDELTGSPGVAAYDPLRIVLDVRGTGCTGVELAAALRETYDTHAELATTATLVFIVGIAERAETLMRAAGDVEEVVGRLRREGATTTPIYAPEGKPELAISPRDAFLGRTEVVATSAAAGRISSESIAGYPPGIPAILPGERVTEAIVTYLRENVAAGLRLHGASDPAFETMHVVAES